MTIIYGFARLEDARDRLLLTTILRKWKEWSSHHRARREYQESCLEHVYQAKLVSIFRKWKTRYLEVNKLNYLLFKKEMNKKARLFDEWRIQTKLEQKRKYNELCELGRTALRAWYDYVHRKKQIEEKVKQVRAAPVVTRAHIPVPPPLPPVRYGVDQPKSERLTMHHEPAPEVQEREEQVQERKQKVEFSPYIETIIPTREEEPLDFDSDLYIDELMRKIDIENQRGKEVLKHAMYSPVIDESFSFSKVMEQFEPIRYHLSKSIDRFMVGPFTNELIVSEEMKKLGADTVDNWSRNMS